MSHRAALPYTLACAIGAALWFGCAAIDGRTEAWDSSLYWVVAYPLAILAAGALGYCFPRRPWRWAIALFLAQFVAMCVRNGALGNLWPLGMAMFAVIALPAVFVAGRASRLSGPSSKDAAA